MKDVLRLAGYSRRYWHLMALSVILMAVMGLMTAFRVLLIKEVPRILQPSADTGPVRLHDSVESPRHLPEQFFPPLIHNIFNIFRHRCGGGFSDPGPLRLPGRLPHQFCRLIHGNRSP